MRYLLLLFFIFSTLIVFSQKNDFTVHRITLPPEISYYDNQFSGLYISDEKLFLMSESRLQDLAEPKIYTIKLSDLDRKLADSNFSVPYQKLHIYNLDLLRQKIKEKGDDYEGLEAMVIKGSEIYFSVETSTPSANCYLLKGHINYTNVVMDPDLLVTMPKPVNRNRSHIYNAGFEALASERDNLFALFEYNYFPEVNFVNMISVASLERKGEIHPMFTDRIPFRVTDITSVRPNGYTALNYFYKGGGEDAVYRVPKNDASAHRLITDSTGTYRSYCRLIDINFSGTLFTWKTLWEFPEEYFGYNWEGLVAYKKGYFIMNDKYTPARPYASTLVYLEKANEAKP